MTTTRDSDTGLLIGPDGAHYRTEQEAFHYSLLHLCGCGTPEEAYNFCREILVLCDRRGGKKWIDAQSAIEDAVLANPCIAAQVLMHVFNHFALLEHGGSVGGSWLTSNGEKVVDLPPATEEMFGLE